MKRFIIRLISFFLLILLLSYPLSLFLDSHARTYSKQDWILNKHGKEYEFAFIGSSRVLNVIDIPSMQPLMKGELINLGTSGSNYAENLILLSEFLESNTIKHLVVNVDEFSLNSELAFRDPFHEYNFLPLFPTYTEEFRNHLPAWKHALWRFVPLSRYVEYNSSFTLLKPLHKDLEINAGYEPLTTDDDLSKLGEQHLFVDSLDAASLVELIEFATEQKVNLIFITTPLHGMISEVKKNRDDAYRLISETSERYKIPYLPAGGLIDESDPDYYRDYTHTNAFGSKVYSIALARELNKIANATN